jgi:DNA modification methylase
VEQDEGVRLLEEIVRVASEGGFEFFTTERGVYILGDSRKVLRSLPSESVDAVITDPPWGVGFDEYDEFGVFLQVRDELYRVMRTNSWLVFFFTPKRLYDLQPYLQRFRYVWMIPYIFAGFGSVSRNPLGSQAAYSIVMVFAKGEPRVYTKRKDVIYSDELPIVEGNIREPQFKPTFTVSVLITMFTKEGDLVLDPFAGYGSIPLVCELFGRRWIGIEIDPVKYEVAKRILTERRVRDISKLKHEVKNSGATKPLTEFSALGNRRNGKPAEQATGGGVGERDGGGG